MIVYSGLKSDFLTAVEQDSIATEIVRQGVYMQKSLQVIKRPASIICLKVQALMWM